MEARQYMVNVDGLRMLTRGAVRVSVSGRIRLVAGQDALCRPVNRRHESTD
jgi:hypothetical protein